MSADKFFVQIVIKGKRERVQEVEPRMFQFIRTLPEMDSATREPNLLELERYPDAGLFKPTDEIVSFYAGVVKLGKHDLLQSFHYFVSVTPTKLKPRNQKAWRITDFAISQQVRAQGG